VKYPVDRPRDRKRLADILLDELETGVYLEMLDVLDVSGDQIIERNDFMPFRNKPVAQV
jgi:hypothetical protein